jgi:hypothetical protein
MVEAVVRAAAADAKVRVRYKEVKASRGKVVRAEPVAALYEQGKVCHVGAFPALEDEMIPFTTHGYMGDGSPDRADALIWGLTELFPRVVARSDIPFEKVEFDRQFSLARSRPSASEWLTVATEARMTDKLADLAHTVTFWACILGLGAIVVVW